MHATVNPSLRASMERLKHAGSINGICLGWRRQVLLNLSPYEDFRAEKMLQTLEDGREHFQSSDREVDTMWFGFDGVFVLALHHKECTLVLLHTRAHEVDFLKSAALTVLEDSQLLVNALLSGELTGTEQASGGETHLIPKT